jgi:hypothetical protein
MFTQTHILMNAAILTKKGERGANIAAVTGALIPDSDVWLMFIVERIRNTPGCEIFHYRYLEEPWTTAQAFLNSFPLYLLILAIGMTTMTRYSAGDLTPASRFATTHHNRKAAIGSFLTIFAVSALMHISADFLLHHEDARSQFWPLSDWVFRSPISYWDPDYFGNYFAIFEICLGLFLTAILWQRFVRRSIQIAILALCIAYAAPIYASLFGAADHERGPGSCETRKLET